MSLKLVVIAIIAIPLLIWALSRDLRDWKSKSDDELKALAVGDEWGYWPTAIAELRKRGVDVSPFLSSYLRALGSESGKERYIAHSVLKKNFPEINDELAKLRAIDDEQDARRFLASLVADSESK
jgi:hypothetical protein